VVYLERRNYAGNSRLQEKCTCWTKCENDNRWPQTLQKESRLVGIGTTRQRSCLSPTEKQNVGLGYQMANAIQTICSPGATGGVEHGARALVDGIDSRLGNIRERGTYIESPRRANVGRIEFGRTLDQRGSREGHDGSLSAGIDRDEASSRCGAMLHE
jgi:hypothetical protein